MLKVIDLPDGKQIALRSSAATPILYKNQFGTDFFADMIRMAKVFGAMDTDELEDAAEIDLTKVSYETINEMNLTTMYQIIWVFAKNADQNIPEMTNWLLSLDSLPLNDVMEVLGDMMESLFKSTKNLKAPTSQTKK